MARGNTRTGHIAELQAEIRLLEIGWDVYRPAVDDAGVDLMTARHAFQVKTAGVSAHNSYSFWLHGDKPQTQPVDFYVLNCREHGLWLVVPAEAFGDSVPSGLTLKPEPPTKWEALLAFDGAWPTTSDTGHSSPTPSGLPVLELLAAQNA